MREQRLGLTSDALD